jgi:omega-6 fatty acid desaturase (delta-12 desaturase)
MNVDQNPSSRGAVPTSRLTRTTASRANEPSVGQIRENMSIDRQNKSCLIGTSVFLASTVLYLATFAGTLLMPQWYFKLLFAGINGVFIAVVFVIGHDACHDSLTPRPWLNKLLGRLSFLPCLIPFAAWDYSHNTVHHSFTNVRTRDNGYVPFAPEDFVKLPKWRQKLERIYRTPLGLGLFYFLDVYLKYELFPTQSRRSPTKPSYIFQLDRLLVLAFLIFEIAFLCGWAGHTGQSKSQLVIFGFLIPYTLWTYIMGFFTFQMHNHPRVIWYANEKEWSFFRGQIIGTPHVEFPWVIDFILHNVMHHTAHHADPKVPLYRLRESQRLLEDAYAEDLVHVKWTFKEFMRTMRICCLYDYQHHRWVDFAGESNEDHNRS